MQFVLMAVLWQPVLYALDVSKEIVQPIEFATWGNAKVIISG